MNDKSHIGSPPGVSSRPSIFVASSTEDLYVAYAVQDALKNDAEVTVWDQGVFGPTDFILEAIVRQLDSSDFGIFILMPDDRTHSRGKAVATPRDNVVFELGLFMGALGRQRSFVLYPEELNKPKLKLPTDILGLVSARFSTTRSDGNTDAAVATACHSIRRAIRQLGRRSVHAALHPSQKTPEDALLTSLVNGALETVCRAVSIPQTPDSAGLRVFIFRLCEDALECTHHWAQNPIREEVGLRFLLDTTTATWAVVRAVKEKDVCLQYVDPISQNEVAVTVPVSPSIACVLAAPIYRRDKSIWGIVDFDASTKNGCDLLRTPVAKSTLFQLSQHLKLILSLEQRD